MPRPSDEEPIGKQLKNLDESENLILDSELAKELLPRLTQRIGDASISPETMEKLKQGADITSELGKFLVRNSFKGVGEWGGLFRLDLHSGTATHSAVKAIGNFFGKSFKPWEAVKWTRAVANIGRVLAVAGTVLLRTAWEKTTGAVTASCHKK